ncbi:MAG: hypothetical protein QNJ72_09250 [Pleurocapsa sp. MO_226.B13]|nr:hypothetical protein [Pleurocapsa sp. MO_226.B13]
MRQINKDYQADEEEISAVLDILGMGIIGTKALHNIKNPNFSFK